MLVYESSVGSWGERNAIEYVVRMNEVLEYLLDHPENGQKVEASPVFSYLVQKRPKAFGHRIFYLATKDSLIVLAVFHSQTSPEIIAQWIEQFSPEPEG